MVKIPITLCVRSHMQRFLPGAAEASGGVELSCKANTASNHLTLSTGSATLSEVTCSKT